MSSAPPPRSPKSRVLPSAAYAAALLLSLTVVVVGIEESAAVVPGDPVLVAAGDIACATSTSAYNGGEGTATQCRQKHTSDLVLSLNPDHVLMLGDGQYSVGSLAQYQAVYDPTWGRFKSITHPTPGDHEYQSGSASGYFTYFGVQPYYSFDIGSWHWISLNSELAHVPIAEQVQWLQQDLASTDKPCIGAFWGSPAFSSSSKGNTTAYRPFWDALYAAKADVVMAGDMHHYERFAKQTPDGTAATDGIRQFVVGTGGRSLYGFSTVQPNSEVRGVVFGVLEMTLGAADYSWQFRTESGGTFTDSGTAACNAKGTTTSTASTAPTTTTPTETTTSPTETTTSPTETTTPTTTTAATTTPTTTQTCYGLPATIVGTKASQTLTGTEGDDVIAALGGNDTVDGRGGNDLICGGGGADQMTGGAGDDRVSGGSGADTITDLVGSDAIDGSTGTDTLNVRDSAAGDTANGGTDTDTCRFDTGDTVRSCEKRPTT